MSVASQLYYLSELDLQIETSEKALKQATGQLGESAQINKTRSKLASGSAHLEELKRQQHSLEWDIDDLTTKITDAGKKLYGGHIVNPKELASLQHEVGGFSSRRSQLEDKALEIMEQTEETESSIAETGSKLKKLETEWQGEQQRLSGEIEKLKLTLAQLGKERKTISDGIDQETLEIYSKLKKQRGNAVARLEQGICQGCHISLSAAHLQQVRTHKLVQCSNCGRILFMA